jgi:very-short-patch-repair endonuclease
MPRPKDKLPSPIRTARELRQNMTTEEKLLWQELRNRRFKGYKFRRQHPFVYDKTGDRLFFYVADFYCAKKKLVVELDGKVHQFPSQKEYDRARDAVMTEKKLRILRIENVEMKDIAKVLEKIERMLR